MDRNKSILNPAFPYVRSEDTNIRLSIERERQRLEMRKESHANAAKKELTHDTTRKQ
jgi:hypothetical protein